MNVEIYKEPLRYYFGLLLNGNIEGGGLLKVFGKWIVIRESVTD